MANLAVNEWRKRIEFLYYIYYESGAYQSGANIRKPVFLMGPTQRMTSNWGYFDNERIFQILSYLQDKGWVTEYPDKKYHLPLAPIEPPIGGFSIYITHEGIDAVEAAIRETELGQCLVWNGVSVDWSLRYCSDSNELLSKLQAFVHNHLPPDNTKPLHSGQIETQSDEHHRHFIISAEWRGLRRSNIARVTMFLAGSVDVPEGNSFNLVRYRDLPPELRDDQPASDFFERLSTQLEHEFPDRAGPRGRTETPQPAEGNSVPPTINLHAEGNITIGGNVVGGNTTTNNTEVNMADKSTTE